MSHKQKQYEPGEEEVARIRRDLDALAEARLATLQATLFTAELWIKVMSQSLLHKSQAVAMIQGFYDPRTPSNDGYSYLDDYWGQVQVLERDVRRQLIVFPCSPMEFVTWALRAGIELPEFAASSVDRPAPVRPGAQSIRMQAVRNAVETIGAAARTNKVPFDPHSIESTKPNFVVLIQALSPDALKHYAPATVANYLKANGYRFRAGRRPKSYGREIYQLFPELKLG